MTAPRRQSARVKEALRIYVRLPKLEPASAGMQRTYLDFLIRVMSESEREAYYAGVSVRQRAGL